MRNDPTLPLARFALLFLLLVLVAAEAWLAITMVLRSHEAQGGFASWFGEFSFKLWQIISFQTKPSPRPDHTAMFALLLGAILVVVAAICVVARFERREREATQPPLTEVLTRLAASTEAKSIRLRGLSARLEHLLPVPEAQTISPRDEPSHTR